MRLSFGMFRDLWTHAGSHDCCQCYYSADRAEHHRSATRRRYGQAGVQRRTASSSLGDRLTRGHHRPTLSRPVLWRHECDGALGHHCFLTPSPTLHCQSQTAGRSTAMGASASAAIGWSCGYDGRTEARRWDRDHGHRDRGRKTDHSRWHCGENFCQNKEKHLLRINKLNTHRYFCSPLSNGSVAQSPVDFPDPHPIYSWQVTTQWIHCPLWVSQLNLPSLQDQ